MTLTSNIQLTKSTRGAQSWDVPVNNNFELIDAAIGNLQSVVDDLPEVFMYSDTFNGPTGRVITLPKTVSSVNEYDVKVVATSRNGAIGDIYVTKAVDQVTVHCVESNTTDTFSVLIYYLGDVTSYGGSVYRKWYVSPDASITDHGDAAQEGSLAWILAQITTTPTTIELPGNKTYQLKQDVTIPDSVHLIFQKGAIFDTSISIREATYKWTLSTAVGATNEYYLEIAAGGNPLISQPTAVREDGDGMTGGTAGTLAAGEWEWTDNDGLGYSTVYVELSDSSDPDGKGAGYVEALYELIVEGGADFSSAHSIYPEWFGAVGDGTTDDTVAIQAALDVAYSSRAVVSFSNKTYYTGTLVYHGQSMAGVPGSGEFYYGSGSIIKGKDSKDIFQFEDLADATKAYIKGTVIKDLRIIVDDTTDASGSFTRGGVGNAAFAMPAVDGDQSAYPHSNYLFEGALFDTVSIEGLSGTAQNKSCGIYQQGLYYDVMFRKFTAARLTYGVWGDIPDTNDDLIEYAPDFIHFVQSTFNGCVNPFRIYNTSGLTIDDLQVYGSTATYKGIYILSYASLTRADSRNANVRNLFQELGAATVGEVMKVEGYMHSFIGSSLKFDQGASYITWDANSSVIDNCTVIGDVAEGPVFKLGTTSYLNRVTNTRTRSSMNWLEDNGHGNLVTVSRYDSLLVQSSRSISQGISRESPVRVRTSDFTSKSPSTPYFNNEDLFIWPSDINWTSPATDPVITKDATIIESGEYATVPSPGSGYFSHVSSEVMTLGYAVPESKVRVFIKARMVTSATMQKWKIDVNAVTKGEGDALFTTAWTVQYFDGDLTGLTKGHPVRIVANNPTINQDVRVAWIAIVPYKEHNAHAHIGTGWGIYDFDVFGGAVGFFRIGSLVENARITRAYYQVITPFTSGGAATVAIGTGENANDIITATAYGNAIFNSGYHEGNQTGSLALFGTQTTGIKDVRLTVAAADLTAGKVKVWWEYVVGE